VRTLKTLKMQQMVQDISVMEWPEISLLKGIINEQYNIFASFNETHFKISLVTYEMTQTPRQECYLSNN